MIQGEDEQLQQVEDSFGVFTDKYPIIVELGLDLAALVKQKINGETARDKVVLMRKSIITDLGINVHELTLKIIRVLDHADDTLFVLKVRRQLKEF